MPRQRITARVGKIGGGWSLFVSKGRAQVIKTWKKAVKREPRDLTLFVRTVRKGSCPRGSLIPLNVKGMKGVWILEACSVRTSVWCQQNELTEGTKVGDSHHDGYSVLLEERKPMGRVGMK